MLNATVVIPTYNRPELLRRTLLALNEQSCVGDFETVVVDDGSYTDTKALIDVLSLKFPCAWYWQPNMGFRAAMARNTGILFSKGELIIFLDDDMIAPRDFVEAHINFHKSHPFTVAVGFRHRVSYEDWITSNPKDWSEWDNVAVPDPKLKVLQGETWRKSPWAYFSTSNASVRKQHLIEVGLFDEGFIGWGFEDTELAYRLYAAGLTHNLLLQPIPYHLEPAKFDMTKVNQYSLPPEKLAGYRTNGDLFSAKYPDDQDLRKLISDDKILRMLASEGLMGEEGEPSSDAKRENLATMKTSEDAIPACVVPPHLSLLTAYEEDNMPAKLSLLAPYEEGEDVTSEALLSEPVAKLLESVKNKEGGVSSLEELEEAFDGGGFTDGILARRFWTLLLSPIVFLVCLTLVIVMVVSGRYGKIFRDPRG